MHIQTRALCVALYCVGLRAEAFASNKLLERATKRRVTRIDFRPSCASQHCCYYEPCAFSQANGCALEESGQFLLPHCTLGQPPLVNTYASVVLAGEQPISKAREQQRPGVRRFITQDSVRATAAVRNPHLHASVFPRSAGSSPRMGGMRMRKKKWKGPTDRWKAAANLRGIPRYTRIDGEKPVYIFGECVFSFAASLAPTSRTKAITTARARSARGPNRLDTRAALGLPCARRAHPPPRSRPLPLPLLSTLPSDSAAWPLRPHALLHSSCVRGGGVSHGVPFCARAAGVMRSRKPGPRKGQSALLLSSWAPRQLPLARGCERVRWAKARRERGGAGPAPARCRGLSVYARRSPARDAAQGTSTEEQKWGGMRHA
jgi:hypothetical protein